MHSSGSGKTPGACPDNWESVFCSSSKAFEHHKMHVAHVKRFFVLHICSKEPTLDTRKCQFLKNTQQKKKWGGTYGYSVHLLKLEPGQQESYSSCQPDSMPKALPSQGTLCPRHPGNGWLRHRGSAAHRKGKQTALSWSLPCLRVRPETCHWCAPRVCWVFLLLGNPGSKILPQSCKLTVLCMA